MFLNRVDVFIRLMVDSHTHTRRSKVPAHLLKRLGTGKKMFAGKSPEPVKEKPWQRGDPLYKKEKKPKPAQVTKQVEKVQFASATELVDDKSSEFTPHAHDCTWLRSNAF